LDLRQTLGVCPAARLEQLGRSSASEPFMWSYGVELQTKSIESLLLEQLICRRWPGRLRFQCSVHSLVNAVLPWATWMDPHGRDPELDPPHRHRTQTTQGPRAAERRAVVAADELGNTVLAEHLLEDRFGGSSSG